MKARLLLLLLLASCAPHQPGAPFHDSNADIILYSDNSLDMYYFKVNDKLTSLHANSYLELKAPVTITAQVMYGNPGVSKITIPADGKQHYIRIEREHNGVMNNITMGAFDSSYHPGPFIFTEVNYKQEQHFIELTRAN